MTDTEPVEDATPEDDESQGRVQMRETKPTLVSDGAGGQKVVDVPVSQPEGPQVRYTGRATKRILGPDDWERVGVDDTDHKVYVWDITNAKMIPKSEFSPKQLAYLSIDDRFTIDED